VSSPAPRALRLSVTDRCNFRCLYCMPADGVAKLRHDELPSLEQLAKAVSWLAAECRVERVKLTGGEPLVRSGIEGLVRRLAATPGIEEVSMTTNGAMLAGRAAALAGAGLARVNISLDSLDPVRFAELTRGGRLQETLAGIEGAIAAGLTPVKINAVLRRSCWREEVPRLLDFAADNGVELRFIELMRTGTERDWATAEQVCADEVIGWLSREGSIKEMPAPRSAPARGSVVGWRGRLIRVGWITSVSEPFCGRCNRLRLDARGTLRRCLMDHRSLPLIEMIEESSGPDVARRVAAYLEAKLPPESMDTPLTMNALGG
jgi:cyclic pyranopterin phosphate synthase